MARSFRDADHLPKRRGGKLPPDPAELPRQRRGTTPQMHGRYPDYDVMEHAPHWDEVTRDMLRRRVDEVPPVRFFSATEARALRAFLDVVLAQDAEPRIPVLEMVDEKLHAGRLDGFRFATMPADPETWRLVARGLDEVAAARGHGDFAAASDPARAEIVSDFASGSLEGGAWQEADASTAWSVVMRGALSAFYSHPWAWNEIGFRRTRLSARVHAPQHGTDRRGPERAGRGLRRRPGPGHCRGGPRREHPPPTRAARARSCRPTTTPPTCSISTGAASRGASGCARYRDEDEVDLLIVGAGAGGSVLAQRLARRGWRIAILESGPFWDPDRDWVSDEAGQHQLYWTAPRVIGGEDPVELGKNNSGHGVGGSMVHYAGYTPRFHPSDFAHPQPRRGRRRLADRLRRSQAPLRACRARASGRRPGLAVGRSPRLSARRPSDLRRGRGRLGGRPRRRRGDARRPRGDHQRHVRQPPALHLPRLLPAGVQGQRQGLALRHPSARRDRARRRGSRRRPRRRAWRSTQPGACTGVTYVHDGRERFQRAAAVVVAGLLDREPAAAAQLHERALPGGPGQRRSTRSGAT